MYFYLLIEFYLNMIRGILLLFLIWVGSMSVYAQTNPVHDAKVNKALLPPGSKALNTGKSLLSTEVMQKITDPISHTVPKTPFIRTGHAQLYTKSEHYQGCVLFPEYRKFLINLSF